ncbi:hypothetical protein [Undibacterium sp. TC9W]
MAISIVAYARSNVNDSLARERQTHTHAIPQVKNRASPATAIILSGNKF